MSSVTSLETSKKLFELLGWDTEDYHYRPAKDSSAIVNYIVQYRMGNYASALGKVYPAYDLAYLLNKLRNISNEGLKPGNSWFVFRIEIGAPGGFWLINCSKGIQGIMTKQRDFKSFQIANDDLTEAAGLLVIKLAEAGSLPGGDRE